MTDVEITEASLTKAAEAAGSKLHHYERMSEDNRLGASIEAHARTLDAFEAYKREVSEEIKKLGCWPTHIDFNRFILPAPVDPLVEVMQEIWAGTLDCDALVLREALAKRGLEIREKAGD